MTQEAKVTIIDDDSVAIRKFDGWLGGLWSVLFYAVESRRKVKELAERAKVLSAEKLLMETEANNTKKLVEVKAAEIRKNCAAGVHEIDKWVRIDNDSWVTTHRIYGHKMSTWHMIGGRCKYCKSPVSKKFYTWKNDE